MEKLKYTYYDETGKKIGIVDENATIDECYEIIEKYELDEIRTEEKY